MSRSRERYLVHLERIYWKIGTSLKDHWATLVFVWFLWFLRNTLMETLEHLHKYSLGPDWWVWNDLHANCDSTGLWRLSSIPWKFHLSRLCVYFMYRRHAEAVGKYLGKTFNLPWHLYWFYLCCSLLTALFHLSSSPPPCKAITVPISCTGPWRILWELSHCADVI